MEQCALNGIYNLTIRANSSGAYSQKDISGEIHILQGIAHGVDEYGVKWSGEISPKDPEKATFSFETPIPDDKATFSLRMDPSDVKGVATCKADGTITDKERTFEGVLHISQADTGELFLSCQKKFGHFTGTISLKRIETITKPHHV